MAETILIIDFGSQYTQLIARRVRELNVYCEIHPYHHLSAAPAADQLKGVILSGSPCSVLNEAAPDIDLVPLYGTGAGAGHLLRSPTDGSHPRGRGGSFQHS